MEEKKGGRKCVTQGLGNTPNPSKKLVKTGRTEIKVQLRKLRSDLTRENCSPGGRGITKPSMEVPSAQAGVSNAVRESLQTPHSRTSAPGARLAVRESVSSSEDIGELTLRSILCYGLKRIFPEPIG